MSQHYLVELKIQCGEFEKHTHKVVWADDPDSAGDYAIYCESHDSRRLDWADGGAYDLGGEFHYSVRHTHPLLEYDADLIGRFLPKLTINWKDLEEDAGNYLEWDQNGRP